MATTMLTTRHLHDSAKSPHCSQMLLRTQKEIEVSGYPDLEKLTKLHASEYLWKQLPLVYSILSVDPPLASTASTRMMWNGKLHSLLGVSLFTGLDCWTGLLDWTNGSWTARASAQIIPHAHARNYHVMNSCFHMAELTVRTFFILLQRSVQGISMVFYSLD